MTTIPSLKPSAPSLTEAWQGLLNKILIEGVDRAPRGKRTLELVHQTLVCDMHFPVVTLPERKLHVPFLGGEAYWIVSGDDTVAGIAPYNRHISDFSDDGERFFGAYGPKVVAQLPYIVAKLTEDADTRQAGLTIWRESPPATKDVPCTVSLFFSQRGYELNCHAFMRSSDAWLGLPYDAFNFTMITCEILKRLNAMRPAELYLTPGRLHLTMVSSHLYEAQWAVADNCADLTTPDSDGLPPTFWDPRHKSLLALLDELRTSKPGDYARAWFQPKT